MKNKMNESSKTEDVNNSSCLNQPTKKEKKIKKWRKILYEDQGYEDNYVHKDFLSHLLTNFRTKYKYSNIVHSMLCINHQIMIVLFHLLSYYSINNNIISHRFIYTINIIIIILKEVLVYEIHKSLNDTFKNILDTTIMIGIIWILSPVMISLTQTHSDDTVYLVSLCILLPIHFMFHKYGFMYEKNENIDIFDSTSLSCVVVESVILGSRLPSITQVFSFLLCSSILFFYTPFIVQTIALKNINYYNYVLFPIIFIILSICIRSISVPLFYAHLFGHAFMLFVIPALFVNKHNSKTVLEGPWDISGVPFVQKPAD
ncbi:phosphatidylinositol N-acetylglucosaminyltransferase, putative [Plasmodium chabaudi chabaudi]|uniref:Phosphatidylinositol N-acetylglucosaminyltransferase, putative n=1 Tax=Plasmodium chabaudi chabaudi TaxID=31271 RepID=A0A077TLL2_PLACU|nr:phosphatidylinositol N-acetylglucosaminyltransferase, putative [Plasmodium chabaudi chabaudi]SCN59510.1 phosphatidylinositol N-acetylglucosaminyltransferase, putative [Plasmodium chabaudi chabaudi]VTZ68331.1 phosphatidylinositol N-acetylglucosaminyltransferase, putative [Plasmodium chabaudi chabaudi]|eukprot:XP_016653758.1 phosphatidylinositol N-acetylglucosaminyltransferase, putative [Plasmodium chabaudi chabaudi]